jgi:hypothetical protein
VALLIDKRAAASVGAGGSAFAQDGIRPLEKWTERLELTTLSASILEEPPSLLKSKVDELELLLALELGELPIGVSVLESVVGSARFTATGVLWYSAATTSPNVPRPSTCVRQRTSAYVSIRLPLPARTSRSLAPAEDGLQL